MPVAAIQPQLGPVTMNLPSQPLRRAVYIHISDLTSAYNIDHARLEEELARVKKEQEKPPETNEQLGVPLELDTNSSHRRLQPPRAGYNLCVLVGTVNVVVDKNRVDGSRIRLAEVEVGDETGTVSLRARDDQIDVLKEVSERGGAVVLRNCTLELFQGKHIRLAVTKWGKLSHYPDQIPSTPPPPSKINQERNFSLIDLSLVASDLVEYTHADPYQQTQERENQPNPMTKPYHMSAIARRGVGRRPPSRVKSGGGTGGQPMPPPYNAPGIASPVPGYQGGLHGYGGMDAQPYYAQPQQENLPAAQQQMMMRQQYEMQQRQMHQMYQSTQQDRMQTASPMLPPAAAASLDTGFTSESQVPMQPPAPGPSPFLMPISPTLDPQQAPSPPPRSESPSTPGKMNPQAATFDPEYRRQSSK